MSTEEFAPPSRARRISSLVLFRVVLTTIFFGWAIKTNVAENLSEGRNVLYLSLIGAVYLLTLGYALAIKYGKLTGLAHLQLTLDLCLSTVLVISTGGLRQSVFTFTLFLPIVSAAIVASRRAALGFASALTLVIVGLCAISLDLVPLFQGLIPRPRTDALRQAQIFDASLNVGFAFILAWSAGQLNRQLGTATVVAEQRQLQLRSLQVEHRQIVQSLNSGLMTIDQDGVIVFINHAACSIAQIKEQDALGRRLGAIFPAVEEALHTLEFHAEGQEVLERRLESHTLTPTGQLKYLGFSVSPLLDQAHQAAGRIIIFQDLTTIKALEQEAKHAEHMAAIGQLAAAIAHEIRNPLASISGSVEMLRDMLNPQEDEAALMGIVIQEVDRLNDLITRFLEYSRPQQLRPERLELGPVIDDVVELFGHKFSQRKLQVLVNVQDVGPFEFDQESIRQVLWNLLNNAAEAMEGLPQEAWPGQVAIEVTQRGRDQIVVSVEDQGSGVDEKLREKVFEPFFTTKTQGTGLGLATMYRIVAAHGGQIHVEASAVYGGAKFVIQLPRSSAKGMSADTSLESEAPAS